VWCKNLEINNGLQFLAWEIFTFVTELIAFICDALKGLTHWKVQYLTFSRSATFAIKGLNPWAPFAVNSTRRVPVFKFFSHKKKCTSSFKNILRTKKKRNDYLSYTKKISKFHRYFSLNFLKD